MFVGKPNEIVIKKIVEGKNGEEDEEKEDAKKDIVWNTAHIKSDSSMCNGCGSSRSDIPDKKRNGNTEKRDMAIWSKKEQIIL